LLPQLPTDSRFKIQGSEKTSSIQPLWNQDSRFKAQKKLLKHNLNGINIQESRRRKNKINPKKTFLNPKAFSL
jgi:hypothetical protein